MKQAIIFCYFFSAQISFWILKIEADHQNLRLINGHILQPLTAFKNWGFVNFEVLDLSKIKTHNANISGGFAVLRFLCHYLWTNLDSDSLNKNFKMTVCTSVLGHLSVANFGDQSLHEYRTKFGQIDYCGQCYLN